MGHFSFMQCICHVYVSRRLCTHAATQHLRAACRGNCQAFNQRWRRIGKHRQAPLCSFTACDARFTLRIRMKAIQDVGSELDIFISSYDDTADWNAPTPSARIAVALFVCTTRTPLLNYRTSCLPRCFPRLQASAYRLSGVSVVFMVCETGGCRRTFSTPYTMQNNL